MYGGKLYQMTGYPYYVGYLPGADGSYGVIEVRDALSGAKEMDLWTNLESSFFDIGRRIGSKWPASATDFFGSPV